MNPVDMPRLLSTAEIVSRLCLQCLGCHCPPTISSTASITSRSSMSRCRQHPNPISRHARCQEAVKLLRSGVMAPRRMPALWLICERCTTVMTTGAKRCQALMAKSSWDLASTHVLGAPDRAAA